MNLKVTIMSEKPRQDSGNPDKTVENANYSRVTATQLWLRDTGQRGSCREGLQRG